MYIGMYVEAGVKWSAEVLNLSQRIGTAFILLSIGPTERKDSRLREALIIDFC